jgi:hypothetical protein
MRQQRRPRRGARRAGPKPAAGSVRSERPFDRVPRRAGSGTEAGARLERLKHPFEADLRRLELCDGERAEGRVADGPRGRRELAHALAVEVAENELQDLRARRRTKSSGV